jgi:hypothetical protein
VLELSPQVPAFAGRREIILTQTTSANLPDGAFPLVFVPEIRADSGIGDRGHRKQVVNGKFPPADGNLHGRNFWFRSTYLKWQADVIAGRYRRESNLVRKSRRDVAFT